MIQEKHLTFTINLLVSLFFLTVLIVPKGYNYAPIILSAIGLIYFIPLKKKLSFSSEDKKLIFSFYFISPHSYYLSLSIKMGLEK